LFLCAAVGAADAPPGESLSETWNGAHASLELTATGGHLEFDCAHGDLGQAITLDPGGRFDVPGSYAEEHGGPVRADAPAGGLQVRYRGRVSHDHLDFTIFRVPSQQRLGSYSLERNGEFRLVKCR